MPRFKLASSLSAPRLVVAAVTVATLLALTLMPRRIVAPIRGAVMDLAYTLAEPTVSAMSFMQVESALNTVVFIPLGAALAIVLGRKLWGFAPIVAFAISFTVETLQSRVPGRVPDMNDIIWNTIGGLIGACLIASIRLIRSKRQGSSRLVGGERENDIAQP